VSSGPLHPAGVTRLAPFQGPCTEVVTCADGRRVFPRHAGLPACSSATSSRRRAPNPSPTNGSGKRPGLRQASWAGPATSNMERRRLLRRDVAESSKMISRKSPSGVPDGMICDSTKPRRIPTSAPPVLPRATARRGADDPRRRVIAPLDRRLYRTPPLRFEGQPCVIGRLRHFQAGSSPPASVNTCPHLSSVRGRRPD
jgi:hypothetical protein